MSKIYFLIGVLSVLSACEHVKPLESYLARENMSPDPYVSREATQGGMGQCGAADCGCT